MPKHNSVTTVTPVEHTHQMPLYVLPLNVCGITSKLLSVDFVGFIKSITTFVFLVYE